MAINIESFESGKLDMERRVGQEGGFSPKSHLNHGRMRQLYELQEPGLGEIRRWRKEFSETPNWLPQDGQRSFSWFEQVFNRDVEFQRVSQLTRRYGKDVGREMFISNLVGFMTEWGSGEEALTVQPGVNYTVCKQTDGKYQVIAHGVSQFGNQLPRYLEYENLPKAIGKGLGRMFEDLYEKSPGEGSVILSPQELYEDYDSPGDVINPMVVTKVEKEGKDEKVVHVRGWYLFTNRRLSDQERGFMLGLHRNHAGWGGGDLGLEKGGLFENHIGLSAETLVENPMDLNMPLMADGVGSQMAEEPARLYVDHLNELFYGEFDTFLFAGNQEDGARLRAKKLVSWKMDQLYENLMDEGRKEDFYITLSRLMLVGQGEWADRVGIDRGRYVDGLVDGRLQIVGFHPTTGEDMSKYWDSFTQTWIAGDECGESGKVCDACGIRYEGDSCPSCG